MSWTNIDCFVNMQTYFSESESKYSKKEMHLEMLSAKWQSYYLGINVFIGEDFN